MQKHHQSLRSLARTHGIDLRRPSSDGSTAAVSDATLKMMLTALKVTFDDETAPTGPANCFLPPEIIDRPCWGLSLQLYELRSARNWGIGDFLDLEACSDLAGPLGADFIGLNPLHAPFTADPERCSPYEPSNRQFLNPFYIAVDAVEGFVMTPALDERIRRLRATGLVDYRQVAELKLEVLLDLWMSGEGGRGSPDFAAYVSEGGEGLQRHALFEAISTEMGRRGIGTGWHAWPEAYRTPFSEEVGRFAEEHAENIMFHKWLQWLAHQQLGQAGTRARERGMRIGLYLDLAVGEALDGSATWSDPDFYVSGASIGNPPEPYAIDGQDWRLAALLPDAIASGEASPFHKMLAAAMRYAGAIRIDHAAALSRLFLVPTSGTPADGAYVSYPQEDLLQVLSRASQQYRSIVIGEDLGNIPGGLREDLADAQILSYRILSYERNGQGFIAPDAYPALALACVSTHDHQTFTGWWRGDDIALRSEHRLVPAELAEVHETARQEERDDLLRAFADAEVRQPAVTTGENESIALAVASYRYIAQTPSAMVAVRLADLTNEPNPTNIPGTSTSYPNWKPKLSVPLESLGEAPLFRKIVTAISQIRPR
ncbi:4-alpha-glucanotransferase [Rhizobium tumorigenes]|uniref:4-alpha-glucanotransferase n=1 Tax=Rhizobium tumorigenes TaxID=2041385 RepID=A0AAF1K9J5_9HYPH|nr:4-alpha-glucanotransferase [Rhizobium tumorigenes]WFR96844.1 4-alpha-glucanotransferase [Rhizobium tumorigenes]